MYGRRDKEMDGKRNLLRNVKGIRNPKIPDEN